MRRLTQGTERCGRGALRVTALLTLLAALLVVPATAGAATAGGLKQLAGVNGCLSGEDPAPADCRSVDAVAGVYDVIVSSDGKSVYASSPSLDAIAVFDRNTSTGALTQKANPLGCVTSNATTAADEGCNLFANADSLDGVGPLAISPGGTSVYSVNQGATTATNNGLATVLNRSSNGTLTFNEVDGSASGSGSAVALTVSPDSKSVYAVGPFFGGMVQWWTRDTSGGASHGKIANGDYYQGPSGTPLENLGDSPSDIKVAPDGKEVFIATGNGTHSVLGWNRATSGALTPSTGASRCVGAGTGNPAGSCQARSGILNTVRLASVDNTTVNVASQYGIFTIGRNASSNALAADTTGNCFTYPQSNFSGCTPIPGTDCCSSWYQVSDLAATPDAKNLYVGTDPSSATSPGIFGFTRNGGSVSLKPTPLRCLTTTAADTCRTFRQGNRVQTLATSSDSRTVYGAGNNRLWTFAVDRPPVCQNVSVGTLNTASVIVGLSCSDPDGDAVTYEKVTDPGRGTLAGIQGNTVSYGPQPGTTGVDSFQYRARAAGVASDPATASINVTAPPQPPSGGGGGGAPPALTVLASTASINSLGFKKYTKLLNLAAKNLPSGATVRVTCKTKKKKQQKKGCPYKSKRFTTSGARASLNLRKPFAKKKIPVGAKITITITAPGFLGKQIQYTVRKGKIPKSRVRCLSAAGKLGSCA